MEQSSPPLRNTGGVWQGQGRQDHPLGGWQGALACPLVRVAPPGQLQWGVAQAHTGVTTWVAIPDRVESRNNNTTETMMGKNRKKNTRMWQNHSAVYWELRQHCESTKLQENKVSKPWDSWVMSTLSCAVNVLWGWHTLIPTIEIYIYISFTIISFIWWSSKISLVHLIGIIWKYAANHTQSLNFTLSSLCTLNPSNYLSIAV